MQLSILSIQETIFDAKVKSLNLQTTAGEITVLDNHIPLISVVKEGDIVVSDYNDKKQTIPFSGGVLEVQPENKVVILAK